MFPEKKVMCAVEQKKHIFSHSETTFLNEYCVLLYYYFIMASLTQNPPPTGTLPSDLWDRTNGVYKIINMSYFG